MDQRKKRRLMGRIVGAGLGLGIAIAIGLGLLPKPIPVVLGRVEKRALEITVDEPGRTRIRSRYVISAPSLGQLSRIKLRAGELVAEDTLVAELLPVAAQLLDSRTRAEASARVSVAQANVARTQALIARAAAALSFARDQAVRMRKLHAASGTSQQALEQAEYDERAALVELQNAKLGERVARGELETARAALASMSGPPEGQNLSLRTPVAGPILRVFQESEGVVQPGTPLLEIGDPSTLEIVVDVLSMDAVRITSGAEARIERWGGDYPLKARVRAKEPAAFTTRSALGVEEQRVPILLDLVDPQERWQALGDGYRVEARIQVAYLKEAVVAPSSALFREDGGFKAFVARANKVVKVAVKVGARTPDWVEVRGGLSQADQVVLYPSDRVADGVQITATPVQ